MELLLHRVVSEYDIPGEMTRHVRGNNSRKVVVAILIFSACTLKIYFNWIFDYLKIKTNHLYFDPTGETTWYCTFCRQDFASKAMLDKHTVDLHQGKKYSCDICSGT